MQEHVTLQAYGIRVDAAEGHPNKIPFRGVLTKVNEPSDKPPSGSRGHRVMIPKRVATRALPTLEGMAVDVSDNLEDHDDRNKIGVITGAEIQGNDLIISGHLYGKDFKEEVEEIRSRSRNGELGLSFEIAQVAVADPSADIWVLEDLTFTGAAILKKRSAAYESTSLIAAKAAMEKDIMATKTRKARKATGEAVDALLEVNEELRAMEEQKAKEAEAAKAGKKAQKEDEKEEVKAEEETDDQEAKEGEEETVAAGSENMLMDAALAALKRATGMKRMKSMDDIFTAMERMYEGRRHKAEAEAAGKEEEVDAEEEEVADKVKAGARDMRSNLMKKMMKMFMDTYDEMDTMDDDEGDEDMSMLKKLLTKLETKKYNSSAKAAAGSMNPEVVKLQAEVESLRAQNELITDTMKLMKKLITDKTSGKKGLATDDASRRPEDGKPVRKTMTASGEYEKFLAKTGLEEGKEYKIAEVDKALDAAGVTDIRQRMAFKHFMGESIQTG